MCGVVMLGARRLRFGYAARMTSPTRRQSPAASACLMSRAESRTLSNRSKIKGSPSMCVLNTSQLLTPDSRGSPV